MSSVWSDTHTSLPSLHPGPVTGIADISIYTRYTPGPVEIPKSFWYVGLQGQNFRARGPGLGPPAALIADTSGLPVRLWCLGNYYHCNRRYSNCYRDISSVCVDCLFSRSPTRHGFSVCRISGDRSKVTTVHVAFRMSDLVSRSIIRTRGRSSDKVETLHEESLILSACCALYGIAVSYSKSPFKEDTVRPLMRYWRI